MRAFPPLALALIATIGAPAAAAPPTAVYPAAVRAAAAPNSETIPGIAELGVTMQRAKALDTAGEHRRAERLWRQALEMRAKLLGVDSPEMAQAYTRLADNLEAQGKWPEGEAFRIKEVAVLGTQPPQRADTSALGWAMSGLSQNLLQQGRTSEAAAMAYRALPILSSKGGDTLDAAWGYNGVGAALTAQGEYRKAEPFYRRALAIRRAKLGDNDPDTATSYNNLGALLGRSGQVDEAVGLLRRALNLRDAADMVGDLTAQSALNLGIILDLNGRAAEAKPFLVRALSIWNAKSRGDSLDVAAANGALGVNAFHLGHLDEAERLLRQTLAVQQRLLGEKSAATGAAYAEVAAVLDARDQPAKALPLHDKGLAIRIAALGPNALAVADSRMGRAASYRALGRHREALTDYYAALEIYRAAPGTDHPRTKKADEAVSQASTKAGVPLVPSRELW